MFVFQTTVAAQKETKIEIPPAVLKLLGDFEGYLGKLQLIKPEVIIGKQVELVRAAGGSEKLIEQMAIICNAPEGKYSTETRNAAAFVFGLSIDPFVRLNKKTGEKVLDDSFEEMLDNKLTDSDHVEMAMEGARWSLAHPSLSARVPLDPKTLQRDKEGRAKLGGRPENFGGLFTSKSTKTYIAPQSVIAVVPLAISVLPEIDISAEVPNSGAFVSGIYTLHQSNRGKTLSAAEQQKLSADMSLAVDAWSSSPAIKTRIANSLKDPTQIDLFLARLKVMDTEGAFSMIASDTPMSRGFGLDAGLTYGKAFFLVSDESLSKMVDRAIKGGILVTQNLDSKGVLQIAVYFDHNLLTIEGTTGGEKSKIDYNVLGSRLIMVINNVDLLISKQASIRLGGGAAGIMFSNTPQFLDAVRVDAGAQVELPLGRLISAVVTGDYNRTMYLRKDDNVAFHAARLNAEVGKTFKGKNIDIHAYVGATNIYNQAEQPFDPSIYARMGVGNIVLGEGVMSFDLDIGLKKQSRNDFFVGKPDISATLSYHFW